MKFENQIKLTLEQLMLAAEKNRKRDILLGAVGNTIIDGVDYQIQIHLDPNIDFWSTPNEVDRIGTVKTKSLKF